MVKKGQYGGMKNWIKNQIWIAKFYMELFKQMLFLFIWRNRMKDMSLIKIKGWNKALVDDTHTCLLIRKTVTFELW